LRPSNPQLTPPTLQIHDFFILIFGVLMPLSNISAISWRPVLVVEEAGVAGKNHRPWAIQDSNAIIM
jgi:hypothetical protein